MPIEFIPSSEPGGAPRLRKRADATAPPAGPDLSLFGQIGKPAREAAGTITRIADVARRRGRGEINNSEAVYEAAGEALGGVASAVTAPLQAVAGPLSLPSRALFGGLAAATGGDPGNWWRPWTAEGGVELGGFLEQQGAFYKNDPTKWEWRDLGQGLLDAVGDPTNLLGGIGLLTKGSKLARNAGKLNLAKGIGEQIASGQRSVATLQVPFTGITKELTGPAFRGVGDAIDVAGRVLNTKITAPGGEKLSLPGIFNAAFDAKAGGRIDPEQIDVARKVFENKDVYRREVRELVQSAAIDFKRAGLDTPAAQRELRDQLEGIAPASNPWVQKLKTYKAAVEQRASQIGFKIGDMGDVVEHYPRNLNRAVQKRLQALNTDITQWSSGTSPFSSGPKQYGRDDMLKGFTEGTNGVDRLMMDPDIDRAIKTMTATSQPRKQLLDAVENLIAAKYGTVVEPWMDSAQTASRYRKLAETMIDTPEVRTEGLFGNTVVADGERYLMDMMDRVANTEGVYDYLARPGILSDRQSPGVYREAHMDRETISVKDFIKGRGNGLRWRRGADEQLQKRLYGGQPIPANQDLELLRAPGPNRRARLRQAKQISDALGQMRVNNTDAKYLTEVIQNTVLPTSVDKFLTQYVDPMQSLFKAHVLTSPKRILRDPMSAIAQAFFVKSMSHTALNNSLDIISGKGLADNGRYVSNPDVLDFLKRRNYNPQDPEQVAQGLSEMYSIHQTSVSPDEANVLSPQQALAMRGQQYQDLSQYAEAIPGEMARLERRPQQPRPRKSDWRVKLTRKTPVAIRDGVARLIGLKREAGQFEYTPDPEWYNPLAIRGMGERPESSFAPTGAVEKFTKTGDQLVRMAAWLEGLAQGKTGKVSMDDVNTSQVNYDPNTYTGFERDYARRFVPFYSFASRMLSFVGKELLSNPGGRLAHAVKAEARASDQDYGTPEYIAQQASIPLGEDDEGNRSYVTGFGLMHEPSLQMLGQAISLDRSGLASEVLSQTSPLVKGFVETATGRSLFQRGLTGGRELRDMDPSIGRIINNVGEHLGVVEQGAEPYRMPFVDSMVGNTPVAGYVSQLKQLTDTRKSILTKASQLLTGVNIATISPAQSDQVIREKNQEAQRSLGGVPYVITRIPKDVRGSLEGEDLKRAEATIRLSNLLYSRQKNRVSSGGGRITRRAKPELSRRR